VTDAQLKRDMKKIKTKVKQYQQIFGLENWTIELTEDPNLNASARTFADPRYYKASITYKPGKFTDETIVHELIHIVMALYDFYADNLGREGSDELFFVARENAVSQLTHIMMRILKNEKSNT